MKAETRRFYEDAVSRAADHVVAHLDTPVDLAALARIAGLSSYHFHRIFRGLVGETPHGLHRRLRLERAAWRLERGDASIIDIALDAGYESHEAFTRAFRRAFGHSPSAFRRVVGEASSPVVTHAPSGVHYHPERGATALAFAAPTEQTMHVTIEEFAPRRLAAVRHVGPYQQIGRAFEELGRVAGPAGLFARAGVEMLAIYHDPPEGCDPAALRSDAGLTLAAGAKTPAGLAEIEVPGGRYACGLHEGPYDGLAAAWNAMYAQWLPESGEKVAETAPFEIYLNAPGQVAPAELRTLICVPLA